MIAFSYKGLTQQKYIITFVVLSYNCVQKYIITFIVQSWNYVQNI